MIEFHYLDPMKGHLEYDLGSLFSCNSLACELFVVFHNPIDFFSFNCSYVLKFCLAGYMGRAGFASKCKTCQSLAGGIGFEHARDSSISLFTTKEEVETATTPRFPP